MNDEHAPRQVVAPIAFASSGRQVREHIDARHVSVHPTIVDRLRGACAEVLTDTPSCAEASRDWWPLAMAWALDDEVGGLASVVARPHSADEVSAIVRIANDAVVPVTAAGGRSGVCGASVPLHGGIVLDLTAMRGVVAIDDDSLTVDVAPGTFGGDFERELRADHGLTVGHWPQSIELSTVGGWIACRSAGQYSTRYGKIEDIVTGLDVVLADGTLVSTGGAPRSAVGPDLTQLFVGSEGTLGVIVGARLRTHPIPPAERRVAYGFDDFASGLDACRRILRRGATPAVLRLYDAAESKRTYGADAGTHVLVVLDEGDPALIDAVMTVVTGECRAADRLSDDLVGQWLHHRNEVSALEALTRKGFVVDTMEIAAPWSRLPAVRDATTAALLAVRHARAATCHLSHSYGDGACLYFTFVATPPANERDATYLQLWDNGTRAVLASGGNLSHHHGIGLNRSRFMGEALGAGFGLFASLKRTFDPNGILNPGKLGLPSPFGLVAWP